MKKNLVILGIVIIAIFIIITFKVSDKHLLEKEGVLFAVTLDNELIDYFPERGNYNVSIMCKNGTGKWLAEEWELVVENITGNVSCNIDFTSAPISLNEKVKEDANKVTSINYNGGTDISYRYNGKSPNNYIWFNNEMWRIIGSITTCTSSGCSTNENMVKIIKNNSLGGLAFDAKDNDFTGIWGNNTLYELLNEYYYGKENATETQNCFGYSNYAKSNCNYSSIGIDPSGYYGKMIKNVYWNTGKFGGGKPNSIYTAETSEQTISGFVGIMSFSDYGYASDSIFYDEFIGNDDVGYKMTSTNWLFGHGNEWTLTRSTTTSDSELMFITYKGNLESNGGYVFNNHVVRPVVYLDPAVYVVSGTGTEANPYQIAM